MKYLLALEYAQEIKEILSPFCERIEIAGGIRRLKDEPHDIELVCHNETVPTMRCRDCKEEMQISSKYDQACFVFVHRVLRNCTHFGYVEQFKKNPSSW